MFIDEFDEVERELDGREPLLDIGDG